VELSLTFQEVYVSLLSVVTLLGMGLGLTIEQISGTFRQHWKQLLWGVIFNFLVIPLAALATRYAVNWDVAFFTGFLLCMAAPGGGTGSLLTYCAKGNISFSITLMFLLTVVSLIATPLWMVFAAPANNGESPWLAVIPMVTTLGVYMVIPLVMGLAIRKRWPFIARSLVKPVTRLSMIMLVLLVVGYLAIKGNQIADGGLTLIVLSVASACAALAGGMTTIPRVGLRRSLGFTSSVRNVTLAILLASTSYPDPRTMLAVLAYGLAQYIISFPAAFIAVGLAGDQSQKL
jgi:predicted Na+-dependent transporter